jgi:hypothetical protein
MYISENYSKNRSLICISIILHFLLPSVYRLTCFKENGGDNFFLDYLVTKIRVEIHGTKANKDVHAYLGSLALRCKCDKHKTLVLSVAQNGF